MLVTILLNIKESRNSSIYKWINRILQRFEVNKFFYEIYEPGFRKGNLPNNDLKIYLYFSTCLCYAYYFSKNLQYLSTLLKINDLIISVINEIKEIKKINNSELIIGELINIELNSIYKLMS